MEDQFGLSFINALKTLDIMKKASLLNDIPMEIIASLVYSCTPEMQLIYQKDHRN
jgi:hypothetical protein